MKCLGVNRFGFRSIWGNHLGLKLINRLDLGKIRFRFTVRFDLGKIRFRFRVLFCVFIVPIQEERKRSEETDLRIKGEQR